VLTVSASCQKPNTKENNHDCAREFQAAANPLMKAIRPLQEHHKSVVQQDSREGKYRNGRYHSDSHSAVTNRPTKIIPCAAA
jgi:hypothetical protein